MLYRRWLAVLALALFLVLVMSGVSQAQLEKTFFWNRLDVDITVQPNSDLLIVETWEATFTRGTFRCADRDIPMGRLTGISDVAVSGDGVRFTQSATGRALTPSTP